MNLTPFTFVCPRCRYRNEMEIEADAAWIQVAHWKRDGRCWECAYVFDPLEVIAAFEAREKREHNDLPQLAG